MPRGGLQRAFGKLGRRGRSIVCRQAATVVQRARRDRPVLKFVPDTVATALRAAPVDASHAVLMAGGEGTVLAVASLLPGVNEPLGILPRGTLNVSARDLDNPRVS